MKYLLPLLAVLTSVTSPSALAEDPTWFEVELAVFARPDHSGEIWDQEQPQVKLGNAQDLIGPVLLPDLSQFEAALSECDSSEWLLDPTGCQARQDNAQVQMPSRLPSQAVAMQAGNPLSGQPYLLTAEQLQFNDALNQLSRQSGYQVLLHSGWQMPVYGRRAAQPFAIYGGINFGDRFRLDGHPRLAEDDLLSQLSLLTQFAPQARGPEAVWQLNGWIKIYLEHFLFIETRLDLREQGERVWTVESLERDPNALEGDVTEVEEREPFLMTIPLEQNRRVRSREIHYFDHPKMGVIVQIRRMDQPQSAEVNATETDAPVNP
ncbi:CsiV family protein [Ferrimonas balearica]|uniref:CsiV family protein n=1 Tax=Ferrimonas balearica TaxID=44012 RepID=UPI001C9956A6|nr:CsiV family protein [Ferrimonas balearica]MBY5922222.1 peptidoglycan binding protein CsiV [Ferrimonas balearica]MBY5994438.1 peptidoglycan binding protein CsiV [Ferrimonas balearica]